MSLVCVEHPRTSSAYGWSPFSPSDQFTPDWWESRRTFHRSSRLLSFWQADQEVARVELEGRARYEPYDAAPGVMGTIEIFFFEVARSRRQRGIGKAVITGLLEHTEALRLVAFSEAADGFWASLGWERHDHPDGWPRFRPLFVQPQP